MEKHVFLTHGIPQTIISDNGKQFISNVFKLLLSDYDVPNLFLYCLYHPQNIPIIERLNKMIGSACGYVLFLIFLKSWERIYVFWFV